MKKDFQDIYEPIDEETIRLQKKNTFKAHVKKKIREAAFTYLKDIQTSHSKIKDIKYEKFEIQPYLSSFVLTTEMTKVLFNMRSEISNATFLQCTKKTLDAV